MDIYCPLCREPWDNDTIHDKTKELYEPEFGLAPWETLEKTPTSYTWLNSRGNYTDQKLYEPYYYRVLNDFKRRGCIVLDGNGKWCREHRNAKGTDVVRLAYDIMGDDMDGAMSMIEDAEEMGLL